MDHVSASSYSLQELQAVKNSQIFWLKLIGIFGVVLFLLQGGPKKVSHILTSITLSNLNRFSQFFHRSKEKNFKLSIKPMLIESSID